MVWAVYLSQSNYASKTWAPVVKYSVASLSLMLPLLDLFVEQLDIFIQLGVLVPEFAKFLSEVRSYLLEVLIQTLLQECMKNAYVPQTCERWFWYHRQCRLSPSAT